MAEPSNTEEEHRRRLLDPFHRYFLQRLGLISDEINWPGAADSVYDADAAAADVDGDGGGGASSSSSLASASWRARDAITSLLGPDVSTVMSDSGLTKKEMALLAGNLLDSDGGSSSSRMVIPVDSIVSSLYGRRRRDAAADAEQCNRNFDDIRKDANDDDGGSGGRKDRPAVPLPLDAEIVRRAFDAAAFAIVRGDARAASLAAGPSPSVAAADETVRFGRGSGFPTAAGSAAAVARGGRRETTTDYEPPLLLAMESIRASRMTTLDEASGSESVPPFLKKNNTIPWFHVPAQQQQQQQQQQQPARGSATTSAAVVAPAKPFSSSASSGGGGSSKIIAATTAEGDFGNNMILQADGRGVDLKKTKKKEHEKPIKKRCRPPDDNDGIGTGIDAAKKSSPSAIDRHELSKKKRTKLQQAAALPGKEKNAAAGVAKGGKKEKKDKDKKGGHTKSKDDRVGEKHTVRRASSSSSKHSPAAPASSSKPKKAARTSSASVIEDASGIGGSNARSSRAIISAAAAGVFHEFHPDYDAGHNATVTDDEVTTTNTTTNAADLEISKVAGGGVRAPFLPATDRRKQDHRDDQQILSPKKKKAKEEDARLDMDEVVVQAKRLANRVLDHTKGAARRGDQRRKFRADAALSRMEERDGAAGSSGSSGSVSNGGLHGGKGGPSMTSGGGELRRPQMNSFLVRPGHALPLITPNPFVEMNPGADFLDSDFAGAADYGMDSQRGEGLARGPMLPPRKESLVTEQTLGSPCKKFENGCDAEWTESCLPRMLSILGKGAGHAVVHDMQWNDRSFRVANLLQNMATSPSTSSTCRGHRINYGPHLIVTSSGEDFEKFEQVFGRLGHGLARSVFDEGGRSSNGSGGGALANSISDGALLRALPYHGPKARRRRLRRHFGALLPSPESHFSFLGGLEDSPFHVILTTYSVLVEDYAHFCQIPFQAVVLDDGMSWLGTHYDPHGKIGKVWNSGLWNNFDHGAGRAGAADGGPISTWDFSKDIVGIGGDDELASNTSGTTAGVNRIGLTARHRILLASNMHAEHRGQVYKAPVLGLLSFLAPQFTDAIKDCWERSKVSSCKSSMAYIRTMVARLVVVYSGDANIFDVNDLIELSSKALEGELPLRSLGNQKPLEDEGTGKLIKSQKVVHSRKFATAWLQSSIRKELGKTSLDPIIAAVKRVNTIGFICEEVVTASSLTTSGAGGCVVGPSAYRAAVRCGRSFSSEQGLKQHIIAFHAPAGTWLCQNCGEDCGTSQARTTHERSCGKPQGSSKSSLGSVAQSAGQETTAKRGRKKKEVKNPLLLSASTEKQPAKERDESTRVPGYKGVWSQADGKYFLKVDDNPVMNNHPENKAPLLFDSAEAAAKKFDEIIAERGKEQEKEMNFRPDGSRIVHKDRPVKAPVAKSAEPAVSEVSGTNPDLSVIDIKDLPPHVKPLLRDPNQTSRTGGNSKRYVYAYRGVCRQQRKGHDRWQSQISFNGTNHYLGTFDSEWDAAAVYAWAHLILYGEEATKKAQLEGEEAAAAFEQHEKDIAEGKIPPPSPSKPAKKKKRGAPKKNLQKAGNNGRILGSKSKEGLKADILPESKCNISVAGITKSTPKKRKRPMSIKEWNKLKTECAMMLSSGTKGTSKATILATRKDVADMSEKQLLHNISGCIIDSLSSVSKTFLQPSPSPGSVQQACAPANQFLPPMLIGLSVIDAAWEVDEFIGACGAIAGNAASSFSRICKEFGARGANLSFRTFLLSPICKLGRAPKEFQNKFLPPGRTNSTLGMPVGDLECNIGGPDHSCSEMAAKIQFLPSRHSNFQFMACNDDDIVTLNGRRMIAQQGPLPLRDRDVCSIGARVFVFIEKISL